MIHFDTHTHTNFSNDIPKDRPAGMRLLCEAAAACGIKYLGITDHYEPDRIRDGIYEPYDFSGIDAAIADCRAEFGDKLYIAYGIEYGEPFLDTENIEKTLAAYPYDIVLASLHHMPKELSYASMNFREMTEGERLACMERYLCGWEQLVLCDGFDVYTHPTYPLRYILRAGYTYPLKDWEERMKASFRPIIERGAALEFNSSVMRRKNQGIPDHTAETVLRWYHEAGGKIVTYASDAHFPADVGAHFDDAVRILSEIGFRYLAVYKHRKPEFIRIDRLL